MSLTGQCNHVFCLFILGETEFVSHHIPGLAELTITITHRHNLCSDNIIIDMIKVLFTASLNLVIPVDNK